MPFPCMFEVKQVRKVPLIDDVEGELRRQLRLINLKRMLKGARSVAITGSSRGLPRGVEIIRTLTDELRALGARPFIIPAMGSHGGGRARGQEELLASLGITRESVGAPIRATMETVEIDKTKWGLPILIDKYAYEADATIVLNSIKPHTNFEAPIQSGLMKMICVGLGKADGAKIFHDYAQRYGYYPVILEMARRVLNRFPILMGLAVVENLYHRPSIIRAIPPKNIETEEKKLLKASQRLMGRLPFKEIDLLIVDEFGKDISGSGMDPNVIGRVASKEGPPRPRIKYIYVRDLTEETHGNVIGIGLADIVSRRVWEKMDLGVTRTNVFTAKAFDQTRIPMPADSDEEAIVAALSALGLGDPKKARIVWIKNTRELATFKISESLLKEARANPDLEVSKEGARPLLP